MLKKILRKYKDNLHALQIEELTIKHHLSKMRTRDTDALPDTDDVQVLRTMDHGHPAEKEALNLTPINTEKTPLIQRMLNDYVTYDEEEEDDI